MAHFAGLVAAGLHPSPIPFADVVTTTTHKTLGGPRSALILCRDQHAKRIDSNVFPGQQGGPLMHAIAAKAVTLKLADTPEFRDRQLRTLQGAQTLAHRLLEPDATRAGIAAVSGGTDVHLVLVDLRNSALTGRGAEDALHDVGITVNRNAVPGDPRPPMITSGLRIGTPAVEIALIAIKRLADRNRAVRVISAANSAGLTERGGVGSRPASTREPAPGGMTTARPVVRLLSDTLPLRTATCA